jgi:hypothetical protein
MSHVEICSRTVFKFDTANPAGGRRELSSYPGAPRWLPAIAIHGTSIWLFGGIFASGPNLPVTDFDGVLKCDLTRGQWNAMPPLPKPPAAIQTLCALALGNDICSSQDISTCGNSTCTLNDIRRRLQCHEGLCRRLLLAGSAYYRCGEREHAARSTPPFLMDSHCSYLLLPKVMSRI